MHDDPRDRSSPAATLDVAVFAGLAESVGARTVALPWTGGRVADLRASFAARAPGAAALVARSAVVVNGRHATDDETVPPAADVAILPPVSGG